MSNLKDICDDHGPGVLRTITGELVDIKNTDAKTINLADVAWASGRILRYNGHIKQDYTVAHHCVIMSYAVSEERALEALLHDCGEAYMGDITYPVKLLFPAIEKLESKLAGTIMTTLCGDALSYCINKRNGAYKRSEEVLAADRELYGHECFAFGDRPGAYSAAMQAAWTKAVNEHQELWGAGMYPYIHRFSELTGSSLSRQRLNELVEPLWYGGQEEFAGVDDEVILEITKAAAELL